MASGSEQVTEQSVQQDTQAAYTAACAFFGEQVLGIGDEDWPLPTACADWDVRSVVAHVVLEGSGRALGDDQAVVDDRQSLA